MWQYIRSLGRRGKDPAQADSLALAAAMERSQAVVEFAPDGTVLRANDNFLRVMGYSAAEVAGQHHRMFVDAGDAATEAYRLFWRKLAGGEFDAGIYRRIAKGGREVWIRATYNPVLDEDGRPVKVVKLATDVTEVKRHTAEMEGRMQALNRSQAVIEFGLDGTILHANDNFLQVMGYTLDEVVGRHHGLFVPEAERTSDAYRRFWEKLGQGEFDAGQYRRLAKDGHEVWIQASYNPILDASGRPYKVMKVAVDITAQRERERVATAYRSALENVTSNVMIADTDNRIVFINHAARDLMSGNQQAFRRDLPQFDASKLLGANIDTFHKRPAHQRDLLAGLTKPFRSQMSIGGRAMTITANAMLDEGGRRVGTVVEWGDRTQELATESEIDEVVRGALDGQLTRRLALAGKTGFFAKLATDINGLMDNLSGLVDQVARSSREVDRAALEISDGSTRLAQRTEEQASSLEETAASMEQMTSTVRQNANNASQANQLAQAARSQAEKGGAVAVEASTAMAQINASSRRIADIIGVIDEIAFQTNLLALNAAVEAARAGEQGRGFAVVASEVRSLAGRSGTAAREIHSLIAESVQSVENGAKLVTQSADSLQQIVESVKRVTDIVAEIAAASNEQSAGIEQVNKAVMQLDSLTQENAALVEQSTAASQSMAEGAQQLAALVARYRVGEHQPVDDRRRVAASR